MPLATLTSKGQVTLPKEVRDSLHLSAGDKIDIFVTEAGEGIIRPISKKVDDVFCRLKKKNQKSVSLPEIKRALQKRFVDPSR